MADLFSDILAPTDYFQRGNPSGTYANLKNFGSQSQTPKFGPGASQFGPGASQFGPGASEFGPSKGKDTVDLPEFRQPRTDEAIEAGSRRAESQAFKRPEQSKNPLGFDPKVLDLARVLGQSDDSDKNMAIVKAGIGMAQAGGQTGNFLSALAAGAGQGIDSYQAMGAQRAERNLKTAQFMAERDYREGMLGTQRDQNDIARGNSATQARLAGVQESEAKLKGDPNSPQNLLYAAQARAAEGQNVASRADAAKRNAEAAVLKDGVTPAIQRLAATYAERRTNAAKSTFSSPEQESAFYDEAYAEGLLRYGNPQPGAPGTPSPAEPPKEASKGVPWMQGDWAQEKLPENEVPLAGNMAIFIPSASVKEAAQRGAFGKYDPGVAFNMGKNSLSLFNNDLVQLKQQSGRPMKRLTELLEKTFPKEGVFVSGPQNFDILQSLGSDLMKELKDDEESLRKYGISPAGKRKAEESIKLEKKMLNTLYGDKMPTEYKRFEGDITMPDKEKRPADPELDAILNLYK